MTNTSEAGLETLIAEAFSDEQIVATLTRQLIRPPSGSADAER